MEWCQASLNVPKIVKDRLLATHAQNQALRFASTLKNSQNQSPPKDRQFQQQGRQ